MVELDILRCCKSFSCWCKFCYDGKSALAGTDESPGEVVLFKEENSKLIEEWVQLEL